MRLDWFLPFPRKKKKKKEALPSTAWAVRVAQRWLPTSWFADRVTGKPGLIRRVLKRVGPSVLSSPVRRVVQTVCLALFLVLFFYVCWPYSAKPADEGRRSAGWSFVEAGEDGNFTWQHTEAPSWVVEQSRTLHVVDADAVDDKTGYVGAFTLASTTRADVVLRPKGDLSPEQFARFLISPGPWSLLEKEPERWPSHYADDFAHKELVSAELFLVIDPLVSLSTAIASRSWVWSLNAWRSFWRSAC